MIDFMIYLQENRYKYTGTHLIVLQNNHLPFSEVIPLHSLSLRTTRVDVSHTLDEGSLWDAVEFSVHIALDVGNVRK